MSIRTILLATILLFVSDLSHAQVDYKNDAKYIELRDSMSYAFNDNDSARFYMHLKKLQHYLLKKHDMHGYYTQRCNDIIFEMNRQKIFEAYSKAQKLTKELRQKRLNKEMYMAVNMMGHINRYCGNDNAAKQCFYRVIEMMKDHGYYESIPPIFMNIVNVALDDSPEEAEALLDSAKWYAEKYRQEMVFDIETRKTLSFYNSGQIERFLKGYKQYREGVEAGKSTLHGHMMEIYYLAAQGQVDEAVSMAKKKIGDDAMESIPIIYEHAGRWEEAYRSFKDYSQRGDSIDNVVITNSMKGIQDQIELYDAEKKAATDRTYALLGFIFLLILLIVTLAYIVYTRRKHEQEMRVAYNKIMESERIKRSFIQNVTHEVRTPLNIVTGFAQVLADPDQTLDREERQHIANMMEKNTRQAIILMDEVIGLSMLDSTEEATKNDHPKINKLLQIVQQEYQKYVTDETVVRIQSELPDEFRLTTNEYFLRRILTCLMDNASKYTQRGSITMRTRIEDKNLIMTIEDTGSGIPLEDANKVFERFVKLDNFKEGIGLGLPLAKKLAELLGGKLELDTTYTDGARFIVTLPISE